MVSSKPISPKKMARPHGIRSLHVKMPPSVDCDLQLDVIFGAWGFTTQNSKVRRLFLQSPRRTAPISLSLLRNWYWRPAVGLQSRLDPGGMMAPSAVWDHLSVHVDAKPLDTVPSAFGHLLLDQSGKLQLSKPSIRIGDWTFATQWARLKQSSVSALFHSKMKTTPNGTHTANIVIGMALALCPAMSSSAGCLNLYPCWSPSHKGPPAEHWPAGPSLSFDSTETPARCTHGGADMRMSFTITAECGLIDSVGFARIPMQVFAACCGRPARQPRLDGFAKAGDSRLHTEATVLYACVWGTAVGEFPCVASRLPNASHPTSST